MTRTFDDRLAALRAGIENHETARAVVATALGVAGHRYATDAGMIRDLFGELNAGRARFEICDLGIVRGCNDLGRQVVWDYLEAEAAGGVFTTDLNGKAGPALWLRALVSSLTLAEQWRRSPHRLTDAEVVELDRQFEEANRDRAAFEAEILAAAWSE